MTGIFDTETILRKRYPLINDGHGNQVRDRAAEPDTLPIEGCSADPGATDEDLAGRDATLVQWTIRAPLGVDVLSTDDVEYRGTDFSVDGEPVPLEGPVEILNHTLILLKTWRG